MSTEVEIGRSKRALRAYSFDDIALVPARRTRDTSEVRVGWRDRRLPRGPSGHGLAHGLGHEP